MYHFFIHSSADGHLGCLCVLTIVNSAAMNIGGECIFLNYDFCLDICPGVGMLDCLIIVFLVF